MSGPESVAGGLQGAVARHVRGNLAQRLLTSAILIPLVITLVWRGGILFLVGVIGIVVLALREFYRLIEDKGARPLVGLGLLAGGALPVVAYFGSDYSVMLLLTATLLGLMVGQLGKAEIAESLASISGTFFGIFYVAWLLSHAILLRDFGRVAIAKWGEPAIWIAVDAGRFYLLFAIAAVVACDAGAYFAGRAYGRRKLAPRISPGKTVEGALGGVAAAMLAGVALKLLFDLAWPSLSRDMSYGAALLFGLVAAVAGIVGDLVESLLKRDAKRKDTGTLLPGVGGVLDRIDSSLLAIPVFYYLLLAYTYRNLP